MNKASPKTALAEQERTNSEKGCQCMPKGCQHGAKVDATSHYKSMKKLVTKQLTKIMNNDDKTVPEWNQKS